MSPLLLTTKEKFFHKKYLFTDFSAIYKTLCLYAQGFLFFDLLKRLIEANSWGIGLP